MNRLWRAPCKGGVSQWVQIPPGDGAPAGSDWSSHGGNEVAGRTGKARKRGNQDELAKPLVGVQLVQVQPGQSRSRSPATGGNRTCQSLFIKIWFPSRLPGWRLQGLTHPTR